MKIIYNQREKARLPYSRSTMEVQWKYRRGSESTVGVKGSAVGVQGSKPPLAIKGPGPSIMVWHIAVFLWKNPPTPVGRFLQIFALEGPSIAWGGGYSGSTKDYGGSTVEIQRNTVGMRW